MGNISTEDIIARTLASDLAEEKKQELIAIYMGKKLPQLTMDTVAKAMFSPDEHPDRYAFLMKHIMRDDTIETDGSMRNELLLTSINAKKVISDIPGRFTDGRIGDIEFQVASQAYIDTRIDIYSSSMLMVQYTAEKSQARKEIDYRNVKDAVIVVLMRRSPKKFSSYKSPRYIHRVIEYVADSGLRLDTPRKIAYVQLDKALEAFRHGRYCQEGDKKLLLWLAMIADVNDPKVVSRTAKDTELSRLRSDLYVFSRGKEEQAMILADQLAEMDYIAAIRNGHEEGFEEGRAEGRAEGHTDGVQDLACAIHRLKDGETAEHLFASGVSREVIEAAISCL